MQQFCTNALGLSEALGLQAEAKLELEVTHMHITSAICKSETI